jgi:hypothetical protein
VPQKAAVFGRVAILPRGNPHTDLKGANLPLYRMTGAQAAAIGTNRHSGGYANLPTLTGAQAAALHDVVENRPIAFLRQRTSASSPC